jgi:hypothetical protein
MGNIAWLASYPKSGNTWLRAFIYNLFMQPEQAGGITEFPKYFESESDRNWYTPFFGNRALDSIDPDEFFALRERVHKRIAKKVAAGTVYTKTHNRFGKVNGHPLHNLAVTAGAIVVVRNPLDIVLSMADHFGRSLDDTIKSMANEYAFSPGDDMNVANFLGSWSSHVASWTTQGHAGILVIRYEDMLDQPLKTFHRVATLLGLGDDRSRIEQAVRFSSFSALRKQEMEMGFIERSPHSEYFFRAGRKNQWTEQLSSEQVALMTRQHREQMERFNYIPTENSQERVSK